MSNAPKPMPPIKRLDPQRIDRWQDQQDQVRQHRAYMQTGLGSWGGKDPLLNERYTQPGDLAENGEFDVAQAPTPFDNAFQGGPSNAPARPRRRGP